MTEQAVKIPLPGTRRLPGWVIAALQFLITTALPVFLVLTGVRLVMTETYLKLEYHRPGFPGDPFGFTRADRLHYAPYAIHYLLNDAGISYLGDLRLNGGPLYTPAELRHMKDVKTVTRAALTIYKLLSLGLVIAAASLVWSPQTRPVFRNSLFKGGLLTLSLIGILLVFSLLSWDSFFTDFHTILFEGDSWQFSTSDTLIRLFPEQFWFDTAISIGLIAVIGALAGMGIAWRWEKRAASPNQNGAAPDPVDSPN